MTKQKTKPIQPPQKPAYHTWAEGDDDGRAAAMYNAGKALERVEPILRSQGSEIYLNIAPNNVSVRDSYTRTDYEQFRRAEAVPTKPRDIIRACMGAYNSPNSGLIRNVIDLMADFASQGITLVHPNERIENFYKEWFRKAQGPERSERFLNYLYRLGNVVVNRQTAKITPEEEGEMRRAGAAEVKIKPREIPIKYTFLNPLVLDLVADDLAAFVGTEEFMFSMRLPMSLAQKIRNPKSVTERQLVAKLPDSIRKHVAAGNDSVPLDPQKVTAYYYKRDDWAPWAVPMLYGILSDFNVLQKLKLADLSALDGAISCIRVWKLGSLEERIMPSEATIARLAAMLSNNVGGGVMDLVWGPDIELLQTDTNIHKFLGETKYAPILTSIYAGLGIPPTLTGVEGKGSFTNNFISLKTLTERLEYGRSVLKGFWDAEIRLVQKAMGFRFPATLVFDRMTLSDEAAEKKLLIDLCDRDLISIETLQERLGENPQIEEVRMRRETRRRKAGLLPPKASQFHDPQQDYGLKKIFAQTKAVAPSQVGLELEDKKPGEVTPAEHDAALAPSPAQGPGTGPKKFSKRSAGRPKGAKDGAKRKKKVVKPRTSAALINAMRQAEEAQAAVAELVTPAYLQSVKKKNQRQLTTEQTAHFENFKFALLCQFAAGEPVTKEAVAAKLAEPLPVPEHVSALLAATVAKYAEAQGAPPALDTLRRFQSQVYALYIGDFGSDETGDSDDGV